MHSWRDPFLEDTPAVLVSYEPLRPRVQMRHDQVKGAEPRKVAVARLAKIYNQYDMEELITVDRGLVIRGAGGADGAASPPHDDDLRFYDFDPSDFKELSDPALLEQAVGQVATGTAFRATVLNPKTGRWVRGCKVWTAVRFSGGDLRGGGREEDETQVGSWEDQERTTEEDVVELGRWADGGAEWSPDVLPPGERGLLSKDWYWAVEFPTDLSGAAPDISVGNSAADISLGEGDCPVPADEGTASEHDRCDDRCEDIGDVFAAPVTLALTSQPPANSPSAGAPARTLAPSSVPEEEKTVFENDAAVAPAAAASQNGSSSFADEPPSSAKFFGAAANGQQTLSCWLGDRPPLVLQRCRTGTVRRPARTDDHVNNTPGERGEEVVPVAFLPPLFVLLDALNPKLHAERFVRAVALFDVFEHRCRECLVLGEMPVGRSVGQLVPWRVGRRRGDRAGVQSGEDEDTTGISAADGGGVDAAVRDHYALHSMGESLQRTVGATALPRLLKVLSSTVGRDPRRDPAPTELGRGLLFERQCYARNRTEVVGDHYWRSSSILAEWLLKRVELLASYLDLSDGRFALEDPSVGRTGKMSSALEDPSVGRTEKMSRIHPLAGPRRVLEDVSVSPRREETAFPPRPASAFSPRPASAFSTRPAKSSSSPARHGEGIERSVPTLDFASLEEQRPQTSGGSFVRRGYRIRSPDGSPNRRRPLTAMSLDQRQEIGMSPTRPSTSSGPRQHRASASSSSRKGRQQPCLSARPNAHNNYFPPISSLISSLWNKLQNLDAIYANERFLSSRRRRRDSMYQRLLRARRERDYFCDEDLFPLFGGSLDYFSAAFVPERDVKKRISTDTEEYLYGTVPPYCGGSSDDSNAGTSLLHKVVLESALRDICSQLPEKTLSPFAIVEEGVLDCARFARVRPRRGNCERLRKAILSTKGYALLSQTGARGEEERCEEDKERSMYQVWGQYSAGCGWGQYGD